MPTLYHPPCFLTLSSHKLFLIQEECKISLNTHHHPPQKSFRICFCSAKKSRFLFWVTGFFNFLIGGFVLFVSFVISYLLLWWVGVFRSGRKVKSDAELCNDIREFLSAVGLPEDHVPSMKELSDNGRWVSLWGFISDSWVANSFFIITVDIHRQALGPKVSL